MEIILDFETVNPYCDLTVVGSTVYSEHWATEILCLLFTVQGETYRWTPETVGFTADVLANIAIRDPFLFVAHGAGFEKDIWRNIMVPQFGFPDIPNERWACTQAVCAYKSVPQSLEKAMPPLCGREKDMEGSTLIKKMSRFGKQGKLWRPPFCTEVMKRYKVLDELGELRIETVFETKKGGGHPKDTKGREQQLPERTPEHMERLYAYCASDVEEEGHLHTRLGPLPAAERSVWLLDQTINERGVRLDREFLSGAQRIVEAARAPLEAEFRVLTDGINPGQVKKVVEWIGSQGVPMDNLQKQTIADLLGEQDEDEGDRPVFSPARLGSLPGNVRRALAIRSLVGSASIRKISRMEGCIAADGRAHRLLQYHGTGPGRWAGRLFNPLNFPRGTAFTADTHKPCDPDTLAGAILSGSANEVRRLGLVVEDPPFSANWRNADPIEVVSSALRHAIVAAPGHRLVVGDFVQIQARIVLALAGQTDFLAKLAAGMDPYLLTAEKIFNAPEGSFNKTDHAPQRHVGKNTFLGCGFQMGWQKFHDKYCPDQPEEFAQQAIDAYRKKVAPEVPKLWYALEEASHKAVIDKRPQEAYGFRYELEDGWLSVRLLDGKKLWYWNPQPIKQETIFRRPKAAQATWLRVSSREVSLDYHVVAETMDDRLIDGVLYEYVRRVNTRWKYQTVKGGRLLWNSAYGGLLAENVVMGLERQLLVRAMDTCEKENLPVILNSYDEIVCEPEERHASWPALKQIMEYRDGWATALKLPIAAEGWVGSRYKKG